MAYLCVTFKESTLETSFRGATLKRIGALAQLVEQWTENPRVPGSNPGGATPSRPCKLPLAGAFFVLLVLLCSKPKHFRTFVLYSSRFARSRFV